MKGSAIRFTTPVATRRPPGARLLEAFSPKLARRVTLFDRASFDLWTLLEADPDVLALCERPALRALDPTSPVDFWVQRCGREEMLVIQHGEQTAPDEHIGTLPLRAVPLAELVAHRLLIDNWQCILPQVNATRGLLPPGLESSVLRRVRAPITLGEVECYFPAPQTDFCELGCSGRLRQARLWRQLAPGLWRIQRIELMQLRRQQALVGQLRVVLRNKCR